MKLGFGVETKNLTTPRFIRPRLLKKHRNSASRRDRRVRESASPQVRESASPRIRDSASPRGREPVKPRAREAASSRPHDIWQNEDLGLDNIILKKLISKYLYTYIPYIFFIVSNL